MSTTFADLGGGKRQIHTNAFNWSDGEAGQVGVFLEPTLAMMNHSCTPNAMIEVIGRKIVLRAETPIEAGSEVEISYTGQSAPVSLNHQQRWRASLTTR